MVTGSGEAYRWEETADMRADAEFGGDWWINWGTHSLALTQVEIRGSLSH